MKVVCRICAKEFEAVGRNAKFCPVCKIIRQREKQREYDRKSYLKKCRIADAEKAAAKSSEEIPRIAREAAKLGMSYGHYVAHEEGKKEAMDKKNETQTPKPDIVRELVGQALKMLERSEVDCKEIGAAVGMLTAVQMILEGKP